jgi:hypothetical protein
LPSPDFAKVGKQLGPFRLSNDPDFSYTPASAADSGRAIPSALLDDIPACAFTLWIQEISDVDHC